VPGFDVATIGSRFGGIPRRPPALVLPWTLPMPDGSHVSLSFSLLRQLLPSAFAIAMLGAIESLLSAVVADGMAGTKHDPDSELLAQGVGNLVAPFFGGFAATGAIARTATNIRSGARSPLAAIFHALFVLTAVLALAPLVSYLPMASLAALLLLVAWNMSEVRHFVHVLKVAPRSDVLVQLACFSLTVIFDMVVSVTAGVMLAALLFMRRMAEISGATLENKHPALREPLPEGVFVYDIAGPLFFGAAQKAMSSLGQVADKARVVILDLDGVPAIDATGLVNLESSLERLKHRRVLAILAGVQPQPAKVLRRAGLVADPDHLAICDTLEGALAIARERVGADRLFQPQGIEQGGGEAGTTGAPSLR
jgi:SulP family sulfate permease